MLGLFWYLLRLLLCDSSNRFFVRFLLINIWAGKIKKIRNVFYWQTFKRINEILEWMEIIRNIEIRMEIIRINRKLIKLNKSQCKKFKNQQVKSTCWLNSSQATFFSSTGLLKKPTTIFKLKHPVLFYNNFITKVSWGHYSMEMASCIWKANPTFKYNLRTADGVTKRIISHKNNYSIHSSLSSSAFSSSTAIMWSMGKSILKTCS